MANAQQRIERGPVYDSVIDLQKQIDLLRTTLTSLQSIAITVGANTPASANNQRIQLVRDPRFAQDAVNYRTLQRVVLNALATTGAGGSGGDGEGDSGGGAPGGATPTVPLPNLLDLVETYAAANPDQLLNSCQNTGGTWDFMDGVIAFMRGTDERVGYNGKRGNTAPGETSQDAISYYHGVLPPIEGSNNVYVIDIISGHCGPDPSPTWNNVSRFGPGAWMSVRP